MKKYKYIIKKNRFIYSIYNYLGSFLIILLGIIIPIKDKQVMFVSYGGVKYDDSPKAIFDFMRENQNFSAYTFIWAFVEPDKFSVKNSNKVKIDSFKYYLKLLSSEIWVTNTSVKRGLNFKKKDGIYINTWHGTPFKTVGNDVQRSSKVFKAKESYDDVTYFLTQSKFEKEIFKTAFHLKNKQIKLTGLPRNEKLTNYTTSEVIKIKNELNIDINKKIILFAPTYRTYNEHEKDLFRLDFSSLENDLGDQFVVLLRAHHAVSEEINIKSDSDFVKNVSDYSRINDLLVISDCLVSDYSSIFVDYSILERPMFSYAYDYNDYNMRRGLYLNLKQLFGDNMIFNQNDLVDVLNTFDSVDNYELSKKIKKQFIQHKGNSVENVIKLLIN